MCVGEAGRAGSGRRGAGLCAPAAAPRPALATLRSRRPATAAAAARPGCCRAGAAGGQRGVCAGAGRHGALRGWVGGCERERADACISASSALADACLRALSRRASRASMRCQCASPPCLCCPLRPPPAVYRAGVSMTCRRQGEARSDLHTLAGASRLDNIRCALWRGRVWVRMSSGGGAVGEMPPPQLAEPGPLARTPPRRLRPVAAPGWPLPFSEWRQLTCACTVRCTPAIRKPQRGVWCRRVEARGSL